MSQIDQTRDRTEGELKGIGGWLILPVLGLCLSPFLQLWVLWDDLSSLGGLEHLQLQRSAFLIFETAVLLSLYVAAPIYLITQLLQKKARFPRLYQLLLAANLGWAILHPALAFVLFRENSFSGAAEFYDSEPMRAIVRGAVFAAIWIPYMSVSVRVRNTFIN